MMMEQLYPNTEITNLPYHTIVESMEITLEDKQRNDNFITMNSVFHK